MTLYESVLRNESDSVIALRYENKEYTYHQLLVLVRKAANYLVRNGVKSGDVVTVALPNIPANIIFFYALNAIGAVQNIVHPLLPAEQIMTRMQERGSKFAIVLATVYNDNQELLSKANGHFFFANPMYDNSFVMRNAFWLKYKRIPKSNHLHKLDDFRKETEMQNIPTHSEEDGSIFLYSGGTTGIPKVIVLSDRSLNCLAEKVQGDDGIIPGDLQGKAMLAVLPTFHGFGLGMGVHAALYCGAISSLMMKFNADKVVRWINENKVNMIIGVPILYQKLMKMPEFQNAALQNLTHCFVGGDLVQPALIEKFNEMMEKAGSKCRMLEGYGLTETVTVCTVNTLQDSKPGSVGKGLRGIRIQIRDEAMQPVPNEQIGEVYITGNTLMNCYLEDDSATQKTMVELDGEVWIRTGDLGYVDDNGFLTLKGRKKRVYKISGINVYPSEVEKAVCDSDDVSDAALEYFENPKPHMILYLLKSKGSQKDDETICTEAMEYLQKKVFKYSIPKKIVVLPEFPKTKVGKIDHSKFEDVE